MLRINKYSSRYSSRIYLINVKFIYLMATYALIVRVRFLETIFMDSIKF